MALARMRRVDRARPLGGRVAARGRGAHRPVTGRFLLAALSAVGVTVAAIPDAAHAGITTDRSKIAQLEQKIADQGAQVQTLVAKENLVQVHLSVVEKKLAAERGRLVGDHRAESAATMRLRHSAVDAYINALTGSSGTFDTLTSPATATSFSEGQAYLGIASGSLDTDVSTLQVDQHRTAVTESTLQAEESETQATLHQLSSAHQQAQAALSSSDATLSNVNANLLQLITAANEARQAAAAQRAEAALAQAAAQQAALQQEQQATSPTTAAPAAPVTPTPGSYNNPLRAVRGLHSERIDQGVDYGGFGSVYAMGDGTVISTVNGGWPGGTFLSYRLSDGPAAGLVVYVAEDLQPTVQIGQQVSANTVIGQMYEGATGIETGWCDSTGDGTTLAADHGQYYGGNSTAYGVNFSQLLQSLGAPGGVLEGGPSGDLPPGWPQW